jgi:Tfp pilus assembly protein PilX
VVTALARPRSQRGVVMYVAIVVLLVMMVAGVAMIRQMGTGTSIAGNLAFRQNATTVADLGTETALNYLAGVSGNDDAIPGYHSNAVGNFDPLALQWDNTDSLLVTSDDGTGNEVRYVMHRLCTQANQAVDHSGQNCVSEPSPSVSHDGPGNLAPLVDPPVPYFRVTTRVRGPRDTISYIQTIVQR